MQREPLVERRTLADARDAASRVAAVVRGDLGGRLHQRRQRLAGLELRAAERVDAGQRGAAGSPFITCVPRRCAPAIHSPPFWFAWFEQRLRDVAARRGIQPGPPAATASDRRPSAEVRVLRALRAFDAMHSPIESGVLAVHVAVDVGMQQRVVQRRVERGELVGRAALDADAAERAVPGGRGTAGHLVDIGARVLGAQVGARVREADVRDAHAHVHRPAGRRVERDIGARTVAGVGDAVCAVAGATADLAGIRMDGAVLHVPRAVKVDRTARRSRACSSCA